jgi:superfamily II DNA or RNA helicase
VEYGYVDGKTSHKVKNALMDRFTEGAFDVFVGTATMATGSDGIDKVCDLLIILDDTDDEALRRQLIGRILPRGIVTPDQYLSKQAIRFVYDD